MDPFGNFGWSYGFGFGWILIGVYVLLMVLSIMQLVRFGFGDEQGKTEEQVALDSLKQELCANKISLDEFEVKIKSIA